SVGGAAFRTVQFSRPTTGSLLATDIQTAIETQAGLRPTQILVEAVNDGGGGTPDQFLRISAVAVAAGGGLPAVPAQDVVIDRAADSDIAGPLGLGIAQGGLEIGAYQAHRPTPSGMVSVLGTDLGALRTFGRSLKSGWQVLTGSPPSPLLLALDGSVSMKVPANLVTFEPGDTMKQASADTTAPHLLINIRKNLQAIA